VGATQAIVGNVLMVIVKLTMEKDFGPMVDMKKAFGPTVNSSEWAINFLALLPNFQVTHILGHL